MLRDFQSECKNYRKIYACTVRICRVTIVNSVIRVITPVNYVTRTAIRDSYVTFSSLIVTLPCVTYEMRSKRPNFHAPISPTCEVGWRWPSSSCQVLHMLHPAFATEFWMQFSHRLRINASCRDSIGRSVKGLKPELFVFLCSNVRQGDSCPDPMNLDPCERAFISLQEAGGVSSVTRAVAFRIHALAFTRKPKNAKNAKYLFYARGCVWILRCHLILGFVTWHVCGHPWSWWQTWQRHIRCLSLRQFSQKESYSWRNGI